MINFQLLVFPGLSGVAAQELRERLQLEPLAVKRLRGSEIIMLRAESPRALFELRLVEDVFVGLGKLKLSGRADDLKALSKLPVWAGALSRALPVYAAVRGKAPAARLQFRVVAQADDVRWRQYRRLDLQEAAEAALLRTRPGWRLAREEAPLEIWLQQVGHELLVSLRLTTGTHRSRGGRAAEREAALRPTIAAAMVFLAGTADEEVFLDPMCGAGTILLERATAGRYGLLLGGDNDAAAVKAALANFGPRHQPRRIERWDARHLPLENASVDKLACNLPWGRQIGRVEDLPALYREILAEAVRVVRPGGRIVLLSSEWELLKRVIQAQPGLKQLQTVPNVEVLGRRADIFVLVRQ